MDWVWIVWAALLRLGDRDGWVEVLHGLDVTRARAFATGDPTLMAEVYTPGSRSGAADAASITAWARKGAKVTGADLIVLSARLVEQTDGRVELEVIDRLGPASVVWADGTRRRLPADQPTRHTVTLLRTEDGWRIDEVMTPRQLSAVPTPRPR